MTKQWHGGKGDRNRTKDIEKFNDNFDRIFGAKERFKKLRKILRGQSQNLNNKIRRENHELANRLENR